MKRFVFDASIDGNDIDYTTIICCEEEPNWWWFENLAQRYGCTLWSYYEIDENEFQ
jgi:hypothetical protein